MDRFWKYKVDHCIFWLATVFFHMYTRIPLLEKEGVTAFLVEVVIRNALLAIVIYTNLSLLIPFLAQRGKYIAYTFGFLGTLGFYVLAKNAHDVYLNSVYAAGIQQAPYWSNTLYNFSIGAFYMVFSIALNLSKEWYFQRRQLEKIRVEQLNTELAYLKSQINPHFLFNSINTIYFQIDKKNQEARETLSRFSDMLRYQLYECNGREIALDKEIAYIRNYVELQRMRRDEHFEIKMNMTSDYSGSTIAPLLLIPFVENAFKHVSNFLTRKNVISITVERKEKEFMMKVFNTTEHHIPSDPEHSGIGLKNVQRRLDLLYPNRHSLTIDSQTENFEVNLKLSLS